MTPNANLLKTLLLGSMAGPSAPAGATVLPLPAEEAPFPDTLYHAPYEQADTSAALGVSDPSRPVTATVLKPQIILPPGESAMSIAEPEATSTGPSMMSGANASFATPAQLKAAAEQMAAGGAQKSSTLRDKKTKPSDAQAAANVPQPAANDATKADQIAEMLAGNKKTAEGERDSAKAKAASAKDLSDGEKIFTALMAVLPGLVGTIGGAAIAGGTGAAAGAAGGLQGAAQGVGMLESAKEQQRQEALAEAAKAQERVDQAANQALGHQEKLQGQQFTSTEREAGQKYHTSEREEAQKYSSAEGAKGRSHAEKMEMLREHNAMAIARENNAADYAQKLLAAKSGAGAGKIEAADETMYGQSGRAMQAIDEINNYAAKGGADLSAALTNPENRALLKQSVSKLALSVLKINDPTSIASLKELETTVDGLLANPDTTRTNIFLKKVNALKNDVVSHAYDYSTLKPHIPIHPLVKQYAEGEQQAQPQASAVDQEAVAWAKANPNSPYAQQILTLNGIK